MNDNLPKISKNKGGRHLFEILSQVKDSIVKKRYNLAWELASKHYQQNKNSLTNEEIYNLCEQSCIAIERKINHRLTAKDKRNVAAVANGHIQHALSLEMSLHGILLPELVKIDPKYFNMLYNQSETIDPKSISEDLVFERRNQNSFLSAEGVHRAIKKIVKQHLKICNSVLMFKITKRKNNEEVVQNVNIIQDIFDQFKQHEFPSQIMDFELIKLSIIDDLTLKEGIKCEYRLPLGFLGKIYHLLKRGKKDSLDHYLRKLNSYLVLSFRHLNVSIQDVFIGCCEAKYIIKIVQSLYSPKDKVKNIERKGTHHNMKRLMTIESEQDANLRSSKKNTDFSVTDKNFISKTKVNNRADIRLKQCADYGLNVIENHLKGRKELSEIILKYYAHFEIKSSNGKEEFIDNPVLLNFDLKNRKKNDNQAEEQSQYKSLNLFKNKQNCLTAILTRPKNRAKTTFQNQGHEQEQIKMPIRNKSRGKFIMKNIQSVKKPIHLKEEYYQKVNNLLVNFEKMQQNLHLFEFEEDSEDEHQFQRERNKKIEDFRLKLIAKKQKSKKMGRISVKSSSEISPEQGTSGPSNELKTTTICLLDEVVGNYIKDLLLPEGHKSGITPMNKLESLRTEVQNLSTERKLLVESLSMRQNQSDEFMRQNSASFSRYMQDVHSNQKEQIDVLVDSLRMKIDDHCKITKNLMKLNKEKDSFLPKKSEKLKLQHGKKKEKRLAEITFEQIQDGYNKLEGRPSEEGQSDTALRTQFDKLRRDVAKNQFMAQNQKRNNMQRKSQYPPILEVTKEDDTLLI